MDISVTRDLDRARVTLRGYVDETGAEEMKAKLGELSHAGLKEVAVDFKEVTRIGSAGIGQLLLLYKNLAVEGGEVRFENVSTAMYDLFQGLKLDTLFKISRG